MEEDILADLAKALPARGIPLPDIWVWLKPTCPFRDPAAVEQALALLAAQPDLDAVRIVSEGGVSFAATPSVDGDNSSVRML